LAGTTTKNLTQPHNCTGSDLAGTGFTLFSGGLFWRELKLSGNWHKRKISYVQEENSYSTRKLHKINFPATKKMPQPHNCIVQYVCT
jgi:hypothetical protein